MKPSLMHILALTVFAGLCAGLVVVSIIVRLPERGGSKDRPETVAPDATSKFIDVRYFVQDGVKPVVSLIASELLQLKAQGLVLFENPKGRIWGKEVVPVTYEAFKGRLDENKNRFALSGAVQMKREDGWLSSKEADYNPEEQIFHASGEVHTKNTPPGGDEIFVNSDKAVSFFQKNFSEYEGNVNGSIKKNNSPSKDVNFTCEKLQADQAASTLVATGNVSLQKQDMTATGLRGEVRFNPKTKTLMYYVLYDDVKLTQKVNPARGTVYTRKAFAEKFEGHPLENKFILTGAPRVLEGRDVVRGSRIIVRQNNETIEVEDSVSNIGFKEDGTKTGE
jgi:lipopolysaccharide export system protein LptA